ncbi:MAG: serine/threonine protein kinase [Planctomycetes bacterium]|nr:serine/threonine protein kinase [Planctomycetota bacterium]
MSTVEREARAKELFLALVELDPEARAEKLEKATRGDADLRRRVEALLLADVSSTLDLGLGPLTMSSGESLTSGQRFGVYEIEEQVGEGGFAQVYRAIQHEPVRRTVAIKMLKPGFHGATAIERFRRESQLLASLDHPSIATIFDAGQTVEGAPFFVLEYVEGLPITTYCDEQGSSLEQRLEILIEVCEAVHHAHLKGLIHRDIKPGNVLVKRDAATRKPLPRVIDFGIAKLLEEERDGRRDALALRPIGTPAYVSPEQAGVGSSDVDVRTDIYSLGALLCELLTGEPPFPELATSGTNFEAIRRVHSEHEVPPLSTRSIHADRSRRLGMSPAQLRNRLRGDLDAIVGRCLRRQRDLRYSSAIALAEDLRRHLDHEPVRAIPPSWVYVFRKFVRRNRGLTTTSVLALLALVATTVTSILLGFAERRARVAAEDAERLSAIHAADLNEENARLNAVNGFVRRLFTASNPWVARVTEGPVSELRLRDVLTDASSLFGDTYADQPHLEAELRLLLGRTFLQIGMLEEADQEVVAIERLLEAVIWKDATKRRTARASWHALRGELALERSNLQEALAEFTKAEERMEDSNPVLLFVPVRNGRAMALFGLQRFEECHALTSHTLEVARSRLGRDHLETAIAANNHAMLTIRLAGPAAAIPVFEESLESFVASGNARHPAAMTLRINLAGALGRQRRFEEMRALVAEAIRLRELVYGETERITLRARQWGAWLDIKSDRPELGVRAMRALIERVRRHYPDDVDWIGQAREQLAQGLGLASEYEASDALFEELIAVSEGKGRSAVVLRLHRAEVLERAGRLREAAEVYDEALQRGLSVDGPENPRIPVIRVSLSKVLEGLHAWDRAREQLLEARRWRVEAHGEEHPSVAELDEALQRLDELEEKE